MEVDIFSKDHELIWRHPLVEIKDNKGNIIKPTGVIINLPIEKIKEKFFK